jgi:NADPH:quinone reductase-like Zn-dependent oxidoreductase
MRAVVFTDFHTDPKVVDLPGPVPAPSELLVRIHAAGMNPFDWKVGDGALEGVVEHAFPVILGSDGAGVVEAVGSAVTNFSVGDRVFGQFMRLAQGQGSYAELATVPESGNIGLAPDTLDFDVAAALPTASVTAWQLVEEVGLAEGQILFVNGGSGGVGQSVIQLAAGVGLTVLTTGPAEQAAQLESFGARQVIDFTAAPAAEQVRALYPDGVHAVIDLVATPDRPSGTAELLREGGTLVSTNGAAAPDDLAAQGRRGVNFYSKGSRDLLETLAARVASGGLVVPIEARVPLADAPAWILQAKDGHAHGKTVFIP